MHYGARTAATPLQIPLTHQYIWGTKIPSYLDWIQLPQYRLPGFSSVKRNDVVVFNHPTELEYPVDLKTNYIKRCIGIAGDTIEVRDMQVYINDAPVENPPESAVQILYKTTENLSQRIFDKYNITEMYQMGDGYLVFTEPETAQVLEKLSFITSVTVAEAQKGKPKAAFTQMLQNTLGILIFGGLW